MSVTPRFRRHGVSKVRGALRPVKLERKIDVRFRVEHVVIA